MILERLGERRVHRALVAVAVERPDHDAVVDDGSRRRLVEVDPHDPERPRVRVAEPLEQLDRRVVAAEARDP